MIGVDERDERRRARDQQQRDLPHPGADQRRRPAQVAARGEPAQRREQHGRDRDREHPLRQHVDAERGVDRGRRLLGDEEADRRVDQQAHVDQAQPEAHRQHQHQHLARCAGRAGTRTRCAAGSRSGAAAAGTSRAARPCRRARRSRRRRAARRPRTAASGRRAPAMITTFQTSGASAGIVKWSCALRIPTTSPLSPSSTTIGNSTWLSPTVRSSSAGVDSSPVNSGISTGASRMNDERQRAQRDEEQPGERARRAAAPRAAACSPAARRRRARTRTRARRRRRARGSGSAPGRRA